MMIFEAGRSGIKVRTYPTPPAATPKAIDGANGLRIATISIPSVEDAVSRLRQLGFETQEPKTSDGVTWTVTRTKDGIPFELVESKSTNIELGFVVADIEKAKAFFQDQLGAKALANGKSRLFSNQT